MSITPQSEGRKLIAAFLKKRREEMSISCEDLGDKVGLSRSTVWRIEQGRYSPSLDMLLAMTQALNCYFFIESKDSPTDSAAMMREKWGKRNDN